MHDFLKLHHNSDAYMGVEKERKSTFLTAFKQRDILCTVETKEGCCVSVQTVLRQSSLIKMQTEPSGQSKNQ